MRSLLNDPEFDSAMKLVAANFKSTLDRKWPEFSGDGFEFNAERLKIAVADVFAEGFKAGIAFREDME